MISCQPATSLRSDSVLRNTSKSSPKLLHSIVHDTQQLINADQMRFCDGTDVSFSGVATMSTKEAARFLGISHRTLEDWRLKGTGPTFIKWGRTVRYRWSDLWDFLGGEGYRNTGEVGRA